jgi:hypothetical protein
MTITIIIIVLFMMPLFNLLLSMKDCCYTNIPPPKIKNKELFPHPLKGSYSTNPLSTIPSK